MGKQVWRGSNYPPQSELGTLLVSRGAQETGVEGVRGTLPGSRCARLLRDCLPT